MSSSCAPYQVLRQDPLVHCEGRTILEVPFISAFSSSFCFPHKKKKKSQNLNSISLPIDSQGWLGPHTEHILPPIAVDTSFCVPFNQLITISHNHPLPHSAAFITHITVIIVMFYLKEHFSLACVIWIKEAFHT